MAHVWNWFCEISAGASGGGGMGPVTVTWVDLRAWRELTGEAVEPWEAKLILRLSTMRANIEGEEAEKRAKVNGQRK